MEQSAERTFGGGIEGAQVYDDEQGNLFFEVTGWIWSTKHPIILMQLGMSEDSLQPVSWCTNPDIPAELLEDESCLVKGFKKCAMQIDSVPGTEDIDLPFLATLSNGYNFSGLFHCCHTTVSEEWSEESNAIDEQPLNTLLRDSINEIERTTNFLDNDLAGGEVDRKVPEEKTVRQRLAIETTENKKDTNILFIADGLRQESAGAGAGRILQFLSIFSQLSIPVTFFPTVGGHEIAIPEDSTIYPNLQLLNGHNLLTLPAFLSDNIQDFTHILVCRPHNLQYLKQSLSPTLELADCKLVYDPGVVLSRSEAELRTEDHPISNQLLEDALQTDLTFTLNTSDAQILQSQGVEAAVLPGFYPIRPGEASHSERSGAIMVGPLYSNCSANATGLRWYLDEVIPRIKQFDDLLPERLLYIGRSYLQNFESLQDNYFTLRPEVDDLSSYMSTARIAVIPIFDPAGISTKALTAAGYGVPLITTPAVANRLGWRSEVELLVADSPEAFARCIHRLTVDEDLWNQLRVNALSSLYQNNAYRLETFQDTVAGIFQSETNRMSPHYPSTNDHSDVLRQ